MHNSHNVSLLFVHIVICTKWRRIRPDLVHCIPVIKNSLEYQGCNVIEINHGDKFDHIHILCEIKPNISITKLITIIKSRSSKFLFSQLKGWKGWSSGYFVKSIGNSSINSVKKYISSQ